MNSRTVGRESVVFMSRRKKAWGPSNPLWRYLNRKKSSSSRKKARGGSMARRSGRRRSGGRGGMGMGGIVKPILYGAIAGYANKYVPQVAPYQALMLGAGAGYMAKKNIVGIGTGAAGAYLANMLSGSSSSGGWNF